MSEEKLSRSEILKLIAEKKITSREGLLLLKQNKPRDERQAPASSTLTKTFQSGWAKCELSQEIINPENRDNMSFNNMILFDYNGDLRNAFIADPELEASPLILVTPGEKFYKFDAYTYEINPSEKEDYKRFFENLLEEDIMPERIVHLWAKTQVPVVETGISHQLEISFYSLLFITQALLQLKIKNQLKMLFLYNAQDKNEPFYAAMSGFAKTIQLENPNYILKVIAAAKEREEGSASRKEKDKLKATLKVITRELISRQKETEIKYYDGDRYMREYREIQLPPLQEGQPLLKQQGTYLITGGTGGIGMIIARYLAEYFPGNIILTGRSVLSALKKQELEDLERLGAAVIYLRADVSNKEEVDYLLEQGTLKFGPINGIFHCAGVFQDTLALNKQQEAIEEVFGPKIYGSIYISERLKSYPVDFFVFFSGLASIFGNVGQIDYAYANAFEDHYARYLKKELPGTRIRAINWPLWENGGMRIEQQQKEWLEENYGLQAIGNEKGMEVLLRALNSPYEEVIVVQTETAKLDIIEGLLKGAEMAPDSAKTDLVTTSAELGEATENYLKKILAEELKLAESCFISTEPWEKYGINSMSIVKMTNKIEKDFGPVSKTLFFEYQNLQELVQYFAESHKEIILDKLVHNEQKASKPLTASPLMGKDIKEDKKIGKNRFFNVSPGSNPERAREGNNKAKNHKNNTDIAIIGISGKYPMAENLEEFWENLKTGRDCITEIPQERWDYQRYYKKGKGIKDKAYSKWGGFLADYDMFDPLFFGITPRDAEMMDPQERLFLEVTWQAMEDAGYNLDKLKGYEVGVYVGVMYGHYQMFGAEETLYGNPMALSSSYASIANRVSYTLDFTGPSIAIDTMCSSSLTTIHFACESIHSGECQMAVAGGVNLTIHPTKHQYLCANNFASTDGRCRSFGEGGDGYVPGEGVGALLLKSLSQAEADGDHIYAVIKASSINHGGRTNGYTVPNPKRQSELIVKTLEKAQINPRAISYLEAHGTGTSLGDPIEITGLTKAFTKYTGEKQYCAIGSVKSNVGHGEAAAGIAGITKILLQMKHKQLVPTLHSEITNPNINFENTPFYLQRSCSHWAQPTIELEGEVKKCPRIAGISAFGAGGSNAHIILEEYIEKEAAETRTSKPQLIILSARNKDRLKQYAKALCVSIEKRSNKTEDGKGTQPQTRNLICGLIAELLQVEALEVGSVGVFSELNLDIVKLNLLVERINQRLNVDVTVRDVMEYATVDSLVLYLSSRYPNQISKAGFLEEKQETNDTWTQQINMREIAYTLQTGREEKDFRLAVIAADAKKLQQKLKDFLKDRNENNSFITGSVTEKKDYSLKDLPIVPIKESIHNEDYMEVAKLWVTGAKIDWNILYSDEKPKTLSLPTYPFERKRYWYNSYQKISETKERTPAERIPAERITPERTPIERVSQESIPKESGQVIITNPQNEFVSNGFEQELDLVYAESKYKGNEVSLQIIEESIALITMQDENNRNMFAENLVLGLMARFAQVKKDPRIKAIIVTGYENIFSMGGTQEQLLNIAEQKNSFTDAPFLYRGLLEAPVPVITAIQGHAAGGGLLFGLFGDIVIMAKEGIYSAVFAKYGFTPGMGATYILKEKFGINLSTEMMYTAKSYSGEELYQKGARVTFAKGKDVLKEALSIARALSEKPLITLKTLKQDLAGKILRELPEYIRQENLMHRQTFTKPEVKERIRYFYLEDRAFNTAIKAEGDKREAEEKKSDFTADLGKMLEALEAGKITPEEAVLFRHGIERTRE